MGGTQVGEGGPPAPRTVLYIEDNPDNVLLVERLLEQRPGVRLLSATLGQAGLALAREYRPDVILLDLHLPDMEGTAVLRALRQDPALRHIPVIVVSAESDPNLPTQMLAAGVQAYLLKPFDFPRFFTVIDVSLAGGGRSVTDTPRSQRTVLYVDDNPVSVRLVELILQGRPAIRLISAARGAQGLELAREHRPALLLLDLRLPDMSGEEVLAAVLADPILRSTPVVILTAAAEPASIERLLALGARAYVTKPLDIGRFLAVVDGSLGAGR
jgi:CheY-like chemotaxis protein